MLRHRTVFFDLETGGLEPHHPDIQIAAVAVDTDFTEVGTFEAKIQFDPSRCTQEALLVNGWTEEAWRDAEPERVVVERFAEFLERHRVIEKMSHRGLPYRVARLAGHNVMGFDFNRLHAMFKRHRRFLPADWRMLLDTRAGAVWYFERHPERELPKDLKLTGLASYFGLSVKGAHDALVDARLSAAIARKTCGA